MDFENWEVEVVENNTLVIIHKLLHFLLAEFLRGRDIPFFLLLIVKLFFGEHHKTAQYLLRAPNTNHNQTISHV